MYNEVMLLGRIYEDINMVTLANGMPAIETVIALPQEEPILVPTYLYSKVNIFSKCHAYQPIGINGHIEMIKGKPYIIVDVFSFPKEKIAKINK